MRRQMWMAGVALAMAGCASSSSSIRQCSQLSGLYEPSSCVQEEPKPLTDLQLPDGTPLAGVKLLTVEQTSCAEVKIVSKGRADIVIRPDDDDRVTWDDNGALAGGSEPKNSFVPIAAAMRSFREWRLSRSNSGTGLTYSDAREERGMALLLIPFRNRIAATCEWIRVTASSLVKP
jgi:hypothetical protein